MEIRLAFPGNSECHHAGDRGCQNVQQMLLVTSGKMAIKDVIIDDIISGTSLRSLGRGRTASLCCCDQVQEAYEAIYEETGKLEGSQSIQSFTVLLWQQMCREKEFSNYVGLD